MVPTFLRVEMLYDSIETNCIENKFVGGKKLIGD